MHALVVRHVSGAERTVPLGGATPAAVTIGRDPDSTVWVDDPHVSRQHARIEQRGGAWVLVDLGSANGTLLNDAPVVAPTLLRPGDRIVVGEVTIRCVGAPPAKTMTYQRPAPRQAPAADEAPPPVGPGPAPAPAPAPPPAPSTGTPAGGAPVDGVGLVVDVATHEVRVDGALPRRRLSVQEFELLRYLHEHRERVCTRRELGDAIWGPHNWDANMLHQLVHRLKEKLEPLPAQPRFLQTIPGVGYRLPP